MEATLLSKVESANKIIQESLSKYSISLAFNGGKDCSVLLHLLSLQTSANIPTLNVAEQVPFIEVQEFIEYASSRYNITVKTYTNTMKNSLQEFIKNTDLNCILMGTRSTDPYSHHLNFFSETDGDYPKIMRCHPLLDWSFCDIWAYIRYHGIPYCCLYDMGYTSLGGRLNTFPCEELRNEERVCLYEPAFKLIDESKERVGRVKRS